MRRTGSFRVAFACAVLGTLLAILAAALISSRSSTARDNLDRTLATAAGEKAALVETELERAQALALVTARVPPFAELYADSGSLASKIAAVAGPHREIDNALRYVWQLYPNRFVEDGYVDVSGVENARIVRGAEVPLGRLAKNVTSWPSFDQGVGTPVAAASITE